MRTSQKSQRELCEVLAQLASAEECRMFLLDLCTPSELEAMADRWRVARLVAKGDAYRKISEQTGVATATVTRVARTLAQGDGGYRLALMRLGAGEGEL